VNQRIFIRRNLWSSQKYNSLIIIPH